MADSTWQHERCKAGCAGRRNCVGFTVDDDVWSRVVPAALRNSVVCLECFDELAEFLGVQYNVRAVYPITWSDALAETANLKLPIGKWDRERVDAFNAMRVGQRGRRG